MFSSYKSDAMWWISFGLYILFSFNKGIQNVKKKFGFLSINIFFVVGFGGAIIFWGISLLCFLVVASRACNFILFSYSIVCKKKLIIFLYVNVGFAMFVGKRCSLHWIGEGGSKGVATTTQHVASSKVLVNKQHVAS